MEVDFIRNRITELRLQKGISEHRLSLELGHARSYIHGIVSGKTLPSMSEFLYMCEYFEITPAQFFSSAEERSLLSMKIGLESETLTEEEKEMFLHIIRKMKNSR